MTTLHGLHLLPSSLPVAGTATLDLSVSPIMVLPGCPGNTWYFIGFAVSTMGRNDRAEASVLQAKAAFAIVVMFP